MSFPPRRINWRGSIGRRDSDHARSWAHGVSLLVRRVHDIFLPPFDRHATKLQAHPRWPVSPRKRNRTQTTRHPGATRHSLKSNQLRANNRKRSMQRERYRTHRCHRRNVTLQTRRNSVTGQASRPLIRIGLIGPFCRQAQARNVCSLRLR
jgi:hypothetical protein